MDTEYDLVHAFIKALFEEDTNVELVTRTPFEDIGVQKNMLYPFVNVDYIGCSYPQGLINFKFKIYALAKRNLPKTPITNWWDRQDNRDVNLKDTELILRKFIMKLNLTIDDDIIIKSYSDVEAGVAMFMDLLDGHSMDLEIAITNNTSLC